MPPWQAIYQVNDLTSRLVINGDYSFPLNAGSAIMNCITSFGNNLPAKAKLSLFCY